MHPKKIIDSLGSLQPLTENEIKFEMEQIHLPVPQNYEDSHSVANEWAIYRWAVATNSEDSAIDKMLTMKQIRDGMRSWQTSSMM